jgi:hypothetical protein
MPLRIHVSADRRPAALLRCGLSQAYSGGRNVVRSSLQVTTGDTGENFARDNGQAYRPEVTDQYRDDHGQHRNEQ